MARKLIFLTVMVAIVMLKGSMAQTTHTVGDGLGWTIPPGGASAYSTWASGKTFSVGDTLVFNFNTGAHDVAELTKTAYDACNTNNPISMSTSGPTSIRLNSSGVHYFICTFSGHCNAGQRLAISVSTASSASPAPQPATPPPRAPTPRRSTPPPAATQTAPAPQPPTRPRAATPAPTPSPMSSSPAPGPSARAPVTYIVGDTAGWIVPPSGANAYRNWARGKTFNVGDILVFNFPNGAHNVAEVSRAAFQSCNTSNPINTITTGPARVTLTSAGEHFYICTFPSHCSSGQQLAINVIGTSTATPPSGAAPTPSGSGSSPVPSSGATPPTTPTAASPGSSSTTPSSQSPAGDSNPSPPGNSAPSFAAAALPATFLSIAIALLY